MSGCLRSWGSGLRMQIQGKGFRALGLRAQDSSGFRIQGSGPGLSSVSLETQSPYLIKQLKIKIKGWVSRDCSSSMFLVGMFY